jgi:hypothetical protein
VNEALQTIINATRQPFGLSPAVKTDSSFLLIYPPERELDFCDMVFDRCFPALRSTGTPFDLLDLSHFLFMCFSAEELDYLQQDEFSDYRFMRQGISRRLETRLCQRLAEISGQQPGTNLFVVSTISLYPLVKYGEVLRNLRDLQCRIFLAFPGEERGGKLHFMNEPDGGNYLAVKINIKN